MKAKWWNTKLSTVVFYFAKDN